MSRHPGGEPDVPFALAEGPMLPAPRRSRARARGVAAALLLAALAAAALAHGPILAGFARLFRVDDPAPSDAIVLLLGGWQCRPLRAAELYRQGIAPVVLLGTAEPFPYPDLSDSALNVKALLRAGVPAGRIDVLPEVCTSTREEALAVKDYVRAHPVRRITVVTTAFHTARARWIFRKTLRGTGVDIRMAAADDPLFNESNWYTNRGVMTYLQESLKRLYYELVY